MKLKIILSIIAVFILLYAIFYGSYYLFNPSQRGEEIAEKNNLPYPSVIAHRGASIEAPESTAPAYIMARDRGADYLEVDLQRTKDGEIVVFHDRTLERTSNVAEIFPDRENDEVGEFTLAELKKLDYGSWFNEKYPRYAREEYKGEEILTLGELIDIAEKGDNRPGLVLELKYPEKYPGIEEELVDILRKREWFTSGDEKEKVKTVFFSFNRDTLNKLQAKAPDVPRVLLVSDNMISRRSWNNWLERADGTADGLGPKGFMCWPWHIARAHERNIFVFPYVVNKIWQIQVLAQFKSDGYITDRVEIVLDFLDRLPELPDLIEEE
ncbi:MAG: glycerophosphodiester phosphodiesterase family protein [Halanaerobiaceae bacterium]